VSYRLIVAILTDAGAVDRLLTAYRGAGIGGATILDGRGMAEHLAAHLSLFAGFKTAFGAVGHSQVVISVVPAERSAEVLALASTAGDLGQPGTGLAFALEVADAVGLAKDG
jgi:nitrogen regulatory protein PII